MQLKLYLNKFLKVDGIENYGLGTVLELRKSYDKFLELSNGVDPDFPMMTMGGKDGYQKKIGGKNKYQVLGDNAGDESDLPDSTVPYETEEILNLSK